MRAADRAEMHREIARGNHPLALDAITHQQSTFTRRDMAMFAHRHSDGIKQFKPTNHGYDEARLSFLVASPGKG